MIPRAQAEARDASDPLASFRDEFAVAAGDSTVYFDGNSLGRLPYATLGRIEEVVAREWGTGLIRSWESWVDLPTRVGDLLGTTLLGARPGEVAIADSTTVNLFKLADAALDAHPHGRVIVTDDQNFPTDHYVLQGLAAERGLELRTFASDPVHGPDGDSLGAALRASHSTGGDVALVCLSHVGYKSGAIADMNTLTWLAHEVGAPVLWDLSHSVGSVPVDLTGSGADLAVGCTYKYVNAGPGAPAFAYVRAEVQPFVRQPIWGWFGQEDQFEMGSEYRPSAGIRQQVVGTPPVLGIVAVEEGVRILARAGMDALRAKSVELTGFAVALHDEWLAPLGFTLASPRDPARRGSHVSVAHPEARKLCQALIEQGVVLDFRTPDVARLGLAPLYTRFVDVWDGMDRLRALAAS
ncbi:MAG TPA: kynureninase [Acidimicrobiales bacterium]|nr:kynureninase [Acidimicrobiales bacterium]